METALYAHSSEHLLTEEWELLESHSTRVAKLAERIATKFDAGPLGLVAGKIHDLGKAKPGFQAYLRGERNSVPHAAEGALFAQQHYALSCPFRAPLGRLIAFGIAGHHAGLANGSTPGRGNLPLDERLTGAETITPWFSPEDLPSIHRPPAPLLAAKYDPFGWAFFTRMLFSALVDADFLETESWFAETQNETVERGWPGSLNDLKEALDRHIAEKLERDAERSDLNALRSEVLSDCRAAAELRLGLFSLTVPTGGGKTLSSLAFALNHALKHGLDRVIYVIPFTSIVEQTAMVFRDALGDDNAVLEHHSAFDSDRLLHRAEKEEDMGIEKLRLGAQNWDRPIVVTTAVQFFESLFANRPGRCRKLHNIARSVVVLDEAQTLPRKLLRPCLAALRELVRGYGTSVVLCTATQPVLTKQGFARVAECTPPQEALEGAREIVADGRNLDNRLKRVKAEVTERLTDADLIAALSRVEQGLVIVNNRRHARELFRALIETGAIGARHLSTAMTAAHRQKVLGDIRDDLKNLRPVRLISTSLIEAGVDISFAAVWRAWAGLDQIVQAAGRCNRNGELGPEGGRLVIFEPEEGEGRGMPRELKPNIEAAQRVLRDNTDPLSPQAVEHYFRELLWSRQDDGHWRQLDDVKVGERAVHGIINAIDQMKYGLNFPFADIADAFRLIEESMVPVIIPASVFPVRGGPDKALLDSIPSLPSLAGAVRRLQRHIVQIPRSARDRLIDAGSATRIAHERLGEQFVVLSNDALYADHTGLNWDDAAYRDAASLIL